MDETLHNNQLLKSQSTTNKPTTAHTIFRKLSGHMVWHKISSAALPSRNWYG